MTVTTDRPTESASAREPGTHRIALAFEDGVTRFVTCREDQTVADASYRQRINIPLDCRDGACGTCKALCESGDYDGGTYIDDALSEAESAEGYALPCCMRPRSDLVLQIAATSDVAKTRAASFTGTIDDLDRLSPTTVKLSVSIPDRGDLAFLPGQYVNIAVPGTRDPDSGEPLTRSYSFANGPHEDRLTFLVKLTTGGAMSTYLTERAAVGDAITFTGPHGSFFLRESHRPVLLLAGGTGLAPVLSMLRTLHADRSPRKAHLIYGVSTDDDLVELDALDHFARELPGFTWDHCVSSADTTAANTGYVTGLLGPQHLYDGDVAIYLCGPPPMVESVRAHVGDAGIEPSGFYYEKFALAGAPRNVPDGDVDAVTAGRRAPDADDQAPAAAPTPRTGTVPARSGLLVAADARGVGGRTVLDAATLAPWTAGVPRSPDDEALRSIAGTPVWPARGGPAAADDGDDAPLIVSARSLAGREVFPATGLAPLRAPTPTATSATSAADARPAVTADDSSTVGSQGYQIGQEHPGISESDALFEARAALELGALELTFGRLSTRQLAGYRLLADATLPYVDGQTSTFVDAAEYTETNAAFHDYLFTQTRNEHLLQAYSALGVKGRMGEVLRNATWVHPLCAQDHVDIVDAFERGDRVGAIALVRAHAERSKQTMRRAMADEMRAGRPKFVTPGRFTGTVVVVTGAAQGIGAQVARRIAAEGGSVVLADRSDLVHDLRADLADADVTALTADLEGYAGARDVIAHAVETYGRVDVVVNNVGGAINFKPFIEFTDEQIRAEIDRSLMTTLYMCRAALPGMVERGRGVLVNVSSAATRGINRIPYSAAKGGVNAITASLALEYADAGVRVVATAPGGTDAPPRLISRGTPEPTTPEQQAWFQAHIDQTLESSPMHRYGTLDEQAAAICFLASDEASYITGTVLPVAGGDLG